MSSDYYGSIAGEIADRGASAEAAFLEWEDAYARREPAEQLRDDFRDAFMAGVDLATREPAAATRRRRAEELCAPLRDASDEDLRAALFFLGADFRKRLRAALLRDGKPAIAGTSGEPGEG